MKHPTGTVVKVVAPGGPLKSNNWAMTAHDAQCRCPALERRGGEDVAHPGGAANAGSHRLRRAVPKALTNGRAAALRQLQFLQ
jgi:hypothetical protein